MSHNSTTNGSSSPKKRAADVDSVRAELTVARNEIKNLRQQIAALTQVHRKDVQHIVQTLEHFRAENFAPSAATTKPGTKLPPTPQASDGPPDVATDNGLCTEASISFRPIGTIRTLFPDKRAVPRQPTVGANMLGCVELNGTAFTNPEHALAGLQDFSHMWIIYHFHRNEPSGRSKVAPPRLNGLRVGVFSTRSPHRPCPIGLSLVEVHSIDGARIYFRGTDMVNGTPVLDIKPYIPLYDNPLAFDGESVTTAKLPDRHASGALSRPQLSSREEPDGEESDGAVGGAATVVSTSVTASGAMGGVVDDVVDDATATAAVRTTVRVPDWILAPPTLEVLFNERAEKELEELGVDRASIADVMAADPRSVYIRTKYGSQIFTFQLGEVAVTCKFDDPAASVTIVRIRRTENLPAQAETN